MARTDEQDVELKPLDIEISVGEDDLDRGLKLGIDGEPFWRVHITPDGQILVGDGFTYPLEPLSTGGGGGVAGDSDAVEWVGGDVGAVTEAAIDNVSEAVAAALSQAIDSAGSQIVTALNNSPTLGGNPTAATQTAGNNTTRLATTAFVKTAIDNIPPVGVDPITADQVSLTDSGGNWTATDLEALAAEVAAAFDAIDTALAGKQPLDPVLTATTASFTTAKDTKLSGIATGATANSTDAALRARSSHTGTQTLSTISDAGTAAAANTGTSDANVPTISIADARYGLGLKRPARLAHTTNLSGAFTATGAAEVGNGALTLDGTAAAAGDVVLLTGQTAPEENGLWIVISAGSAGTSWTMARLGQASATGELVTGTQVHIIAGTSAGITYRLTTTGTITIGSTGQTWTPYIPSGVASTYTDYVPTISQNGARTTSLIIARYCQVGKKVHAWGFARISNAGTTNNAITMSLPVNMHASINTIDFTLGTGVVADTGTIWMPVLVVGGISASTVGFTKTNGDVQAYVGQTPNFAVANNDYITWNITYEAA